MTFRRPGTPPVHGRSHKPSELVGRDQDLAVIRAFVYESSLQGGSLLLSGEPGVGKSALLDAAEEVAAPVGIRVLRAAGAEFEDASFSGLNQVLLPLRADINRLDGLHRVALNVVLGCTEGPACGPLVVSSAVLALLCQAAADRPLLLVVDNLHWVDRASVKVLGFAARRLTGCVGFLAAERTGPDRRFDLGVPGYEVLPLDDDAAVRLVAESFPDLAPAVRQRIVAEARGNPLALLELPARLGDLQRSGLGALPPVLPLSRRLKAVFLPRLEALSPAARYLLLLAVLAGTGDLGTLLAAAAGQGEIDDLVQAEQAGLVHLDRSAQRVIFSHPLLRSAVMELAASGDVRRGHLALATQAGDQLERRAWHLAGAAVAPDDGAASLLEQAARQMQDRGDASGAVTTLMRAAQLSPHDGDRSRLLAEAACLSATLTGELSLVPWLLAEARHAARESGQSRGSDAALHVAVAEACLLLNGAGDVGAAHRLLADEIVTGSADAQASDAALIAALQTLLTVCAAGGRPDLWEAFDKALARLPPARSADLEMLARTHADPARSAVSIIGHLDAAIAGLSRQTGQWHTLVVGAAAARCDRLAGCREALWQVARGGREGGAVLTAISALTLLCLDGFLSGAWQEAWQAGEDSMRACQSCGHAAGTWMAREQLAMIAAARGDEELVSELTAEMVQWARPRGVALAQMAAHSAVCLAALGRGDFEEAYRAATEISPPGTLGSHVPHALWTVMNLVESAMRTGRQREATAHVTAAQNAHIAEISPRLALLVTASAALAAPTDRAGQLFERALSIQSADRWPFEFARVQLAFGEHLRRVRAPADARPHLGAALATFRALGARPWADRAVNELRAARLTPTRVDSDRVPALTTQEQQIASLAAAGLTNKQIGQRLYLSPRTVGSHLYRVFPKLGVSSRAGLRDALLALTPGATGREAPPSSQPAASERAACCRVR